jgi:hypothetical protein
MLVDPMGTVRTDLGPWPQVGVAELDRAMIAQVRAVLPCLEHRRDDVFGPADPARLDSPADVHSPAGATGPAGANGPAGTAGPVSGSAPATERDAARSR